MMNLGKFAVVMAKVGLIGFGGGNALVPIIEEKVLQEEKLDTKKNYDRDVIVANITPGALPVEVAGSLGRRNFGRTGMIVGAFMMALPGALCALLMFTLLSTMQSQLLWGIRIASVGISSFIMYLLVHYIENVLKTSRAKGPARLRKTVFVIAAVCVLACGNNLFKLLGIERDPLLAVPTVYILLAAFFVAFYTNTDYSKRHVLVAGVLCVIYFLGHGKAGILHGHWILYGMEALMVILALVGAVRSIRNVTWIHKSDLKNLLLDLGTWLLFFAVFSLPALVVSFRVIPFLGRGILSALMSFGGGDAYLTIADGLFVESGMISSGTYYGEIVSVVNILPGSILCKTLLGTGYYFGLEAGGSVLAGVLFGLAGFACSIAASGCSFGVIYYLYDSLTSSKGFMVIGRWIRAIIAGLLINIILSLCNQNMLAAEYTHVPGPAIVVLALGMAAADYCLGRWGKVKHVWLLALNLAVTFLIL